ncbi:MAG: TonB-dependent receptor [Gammaproteobacteria bacterium]|nr:TonB-dependent receptor [Gammaproteobacteria bacterium]
MKTITLLIPLLGIVSYPTIVTAESTEEIVVTGTRTPVAVEKLAASTTIITRDDIENRQVNSLPDLLHGVAGIDITNSGGYGKSTDIRMRGTESDHVLVLLDGVRIGSATTGTTAFQHIPVTQIQRIEIVRGPRSSVWGSEAFGGVIHIFTRRGEGDVRYTFDAGGGSYDTFKVTAGASGEHENFHYSGALSYFDSEGIDAREATTGFFGVDQPDKDGYDNVSAHFRGGYSFGQTGELEAFILHAEGQTEFDGGSEDKTDFTQQVIGGSYRFKPLEIWQTQMRLSQSRDAADNLALDGSFSSKFDTKRLQLTWQNDLSVTDSQDVGFGIDYREDKIKSSNSFAQSSRDNIGLYAQYSANFYGHQLHVSLRWDDDEIFGSKTTGGVGWSYIWQDWLKAYASYGSAYKTPTFNELFFPGFGNPDLGPETAESYEFGLEGTHNWWSWSVRAYRTDIENLIVTVVNPAALFGFSPDNVGKAKVSGVEGELSLNWRGWLGSLSMEYLDPEDESNGNRLPRRVKQRLALDISKAIGKFSLGGRLMAEGNRFDNNANTVKVGGYANIELRAEYQLNKNISFRAKVANLLDKDYQTINTFNSMDRNFFLSVHYQSR